MSARVVPTLAEMVTASAHCRDIAGMQVQRTQQALERELLGPGRDRLLCDLSRYRAEQEHWSDYTLHYKGRVSAEGATVRPSLTWRQQEAPRYTPPQEPDRRLPREREPGEDEETPF